MVLLTGSEDPPRTGALASPPILPAGGGSPLGWLWSRRTAARVPGPPGSNTFSRVNELPSRIPADTRSSRRGGASRRGARRRTTSRANREQEPVPLEHGPTPSETAPGVSRGTASACARAREPPPPETPPLVTTVRLPVRCGASLPVVGGTPSGTVVSSTLPRGRASRPVTPGIPPPREMRVPFKYHSGFCQSGRPVADNVPMEGKSLGELLVVFPRERRDRPSRKTESVDLAIPPSSRRPRSPRRTSGTGRRRCARPSSSGISGTFRRIQFTSDLTSQDIIGMHHSSTADRKSFVFSPGPLFANVVLADEINRSTPGPRAPCSRR